MKKSLLSLAVGAAMVLPAMASADVMVYGSVELELTSTTNEKNSTVTSPVYDDLAMDDSGGQSQIGVMASEDLGDGWTGLAKLEYRVDPDGDNIGLSDNREMFVGLKGKDFGQFELGRLKQAYKYMGGVRYDPFVATALQARGNAGMSGSAGPDKAMGHGAFHSNALGYRGDFGPVNVQLTYNPEDVNGGSMTAGAMFKQENWEVFIALADSGDTGATKDGGRTMQTGDAEYSATKIGGQYKMGMHTISAQYEMIDSDTVGSTATKGTSPTFLFIGYQMKMGNNTFAVQIGQNDSDGATGDDANTAAVETNISKDQSYLALGVNHYLSKTMRMHAGYANKSTDTNTGGSVIAVGLRKDFK